MRARRHLLLPAMACCLAGAATGCTAGPIEVATLPTVSLTNGLVGHWRLDEDVGDVANDSSGNGRTGFAAGAGLVLGPRAIRLGDALLRRSTT